jgi:hypothetical protein
MRPVKNGADPMQSNPHPGATAFCNLGTQSQKQILYFSPGDVCPDRVFKDGFQCTTLFFVHREMVSKSDTAIKGQ